MSRLLVAGGQSQLVGGRATANPRWLTGGIPAANCIAAYEPMDAADLATSYINKANPGTYNAAPGTAPTFAAGIGWTGNASSMYLTTGITPNSNNWSVIVRFSYPGASNTAVLGSFGTGGKPFFDIWPRYTDNKAYIGNGDTEAAITDTGSGAVVWAIAGRYAYRNGTQVSTLPTAISWATARSIFILARNDGAPQYYSGATVARLYIYDIDISSYMAGLTTAINS